MSFNPVKPARTRANSMETLSFSKSAERMTEMIDLWYACVDFFPYSKYFSTEIYLEMTSGIKQFKCS